MKPEESNSPRKGADSAGSRLWLRPVIVLMGVIVTGIGAFYFFQAGVSRVTATGISGSRHGARMFAWVVGVAGYWIIAMLYLQNKKKNEN